MDRDQLVGLYFNAGLSQREIAGIMAQRHSIVISERHLRRILKKLQLYRRKKYNDIGDVATFMSQQLALSGALHGYRWFHTKCLQEGCVVKQEDVRLLLSVLDPAGVEIRSKRRLRRRCYFSKGPNYIWHFDGYDKLKPYGICVSGCVDGFSRYVIWLKAYYTNNDPKVIAGYYTEAVGDLGGCPSILRADCGTENGHVRDMQLFLRRGGTDSAAGKCFLYGKSTANQRIESWWAQLRRHCAQFWMDIFSELKTEGSFSGSDIDKCLVQFCFMEIIQKDLDDVVSVWNAHRIRSVKGSLMPCGKPYVMYNVPALYGVDDYSCPIVGDDLDICKSECTFREANPCLLPEFYELCQIYLHENGWAPPTNAFEATLLYRNVRPLMLQDLDLQI